MEIRKLRAGRPAVSSRLVLEEAAGELALERGWSEISITDIALRAGVSRSSFFNYFTAKSDLLWSRIDEALDTANTLAELIESIEAAGPPVTLTHAETMGARMAVLESASLRGHRVARLLRSKDTSEHARIRAEMIGNGVILSVAAWAASGVSRGCLHNYLDGVFGISRFWDERKTQAGS